MNVFLINLSRSPRRLAFVDAQLKKLDVPYERIEAVDGMNLTPDERRSAVNSFRWWCAIGRAIVPAEVGCALSHYKIYRKMQECQIPYACILEDDVVLDEKFPEQLRRVKRWLDPDTPQVVLLSNHTKETHDGWGICSASHDMFAEGYILTRRATEALLKENFPMQTPSDHWGRWVKSGAIRLFHAFPSVCSQNQAVFGSETSKGRGLPVVETPLFFRFVHKFKRCIGCSLDGIISVLDKWRGRR